MASRTYVARARGIRHGALLLETDIQTAISRESRGSPEAARIEGPTLGDSQERRCYRPRAAMRAKSRPAATAHSP